MHFMRLGLKVCGRYCEVAAIRGSTVTKIIPKKYEKVSKNTNRLLTVSELDKCPPKYTRQNKANQKS